MILGVNGVGTLFYEENECNLNPTYSVVPGGINLSE